MSANTFDKISRKECNGFIAYIRGHLKMKGDLGALKKFDKELVEGYLNKIGSKPY